MVSAHDDNKCVLLDGEFTRVDIECQWSKGDSPSGKFFPCSPDGEDENLSNDIADCKGGLESQKV